MVMSDKPNLDNYDASPEEVMSALFAQMVIQQTNMAMMLMGKVPHPQSGDTIQDFEAARMFIDQLEMLRVKTKGNLNPDEERLLKQSLASTQMMFVDAVQSAGAAPASPSKPEPESSAPASPPAETESPSSAASPSEAESDAESKKKFTKKY